MNNRYVGFQKHEVEEYERKRYRGFDQRLVHGRELRILKKIIKKTGKDSTLVLDIPCGYGRFSELFLDRGFSLVSSDISYHMVNRARESSKELAQIFGVVADIKKGLPFKQDSFGLLLSMRFFHHVHSGKERKFILREFSRVSTEWVILSYYQKNSLHFLQRKFRRKIKKSQTQIKMVSRKELKKEVESGGLNIIQVFSLFRALHAHHIALLKKVKTVS